MAWVEIEGYPNTRMEIKLPNVIRESKYLFYNKDGEYLTGPIDDTQIVYITKENIVKTDKKTREEWQTIMTNSSKLNNGVDENGLTHKDFKHFAASVLGESCVGYNVVIKEEIFALASAIHNFKKLYSNRKNKAISYRSAITKTRVYAVNNAQYKLYHSTTEEKRNKKDAMKYANAAVINTISDGRDYSNGAIKWSGIDIVSSAEKWKKGYKFTHPDHDIFYLGNKKKSGKTYIKNAQNVITSKIKGEWDYIWESRAAFSGINKEKKNTWWDNYRDDTENPGRAIMNYFDRDKTNNINEEDKSTFFETNTKNLFGTVFSRYTSNYIKAQGGEFY